MNILLTGGEAVQQLAAQLGARHSVRVLDATSGDLRDEPFVAGALQNVDAVVHGAPLVQTHGNDIDKLDHASRGTYVLMKAARAAGVKRVTLLSSLALFDVHADDLDVRPTWAPQPRADVSHLCAWLAETVMREDAREGGLQCACMRIRANPSDKDVSAIAAHLENAVDGDWTVAHVGRHTFLQSAEAIRPKTRPIKNVVVFGAGGPLATAAVRELAPHYTLRLTDARAFDAILSAPAQSPTAPKPDTSFALFDWQQVDVTDAAQVMRACEGMDAVINCTVIRRETAGAFRVNAAGAFAVMQAAVAHDIRRVVHSGPYLIGREGAAGYNWDVRVVEDVPARPGGWWDLYMHSKLCGQEIVKAFAKQHALEVPALYFNDFVDVQRDAPVPDNPFIISWTDAARAIRAALEVPALPSPFEILHINSDAPHGVFPNDKAKRVLDWQPQDDLSRFWRK
jgi:nucleoside-diphosphate-sugar epimerase